MDNTKLTILSDKGVLFDVTLAQLLDMAVFNGQVQPLRLYPEGVPPVRVYLELEKSNRVRQLQLPKRLEE